MTGLELSRAYFAEACLPEFRRALPEHLDRIAAGLVGEGSECFGFDDELSRDHGWGPRLCLWLTEDDMRAFGGGLQALFAALPQTFRGFQTAPSVPNEGQRSGVYTVGGFYRGLTGFSRAPGTAEEWLSVPEPSLAAATNGEVFADPVGEFTAVRNALLAYYPDDARLRLLARYCALAAQTGQYNLVRCRMHGENIAASVAKSRFAESAAAIVFLLNRRYRPFYKWAYRALRALPLLGAETAASLEELFATDDAVAESRAAEGISAQLIAALRQQGLSGSGSDFLMDHCGELLARIRDEKLRQRPLSLVF